MGHSFEVSEQTAACNTLCRVAAGHVQLSSINPMRRCDTQWAHMVVPGLAAPDAEPANTADGPVVGQEEVRREFCPCTHRAITFQCCKQCQLASSRHRLADGSGRWSERETSGARDVGAGEPLRGVEWCDSPPGDWGPFGTGCS